MFFVLNLHKHLIVSPLYLGRNLERFILEILQNSVEGTYNQHYGYILKVINVNGCGEGKVMDGSGDAVFVVSYKALVFMAYRGEIIDAEITESMEYGIIAGAGPMSLFVSKDHIAEEYYYDEDAKPWAKWVGRGSSSQVLTKGRDVRVKITGIRVTGNEMYGVCEMDEVHLGPIAKECSLAL